MPGSQVDETDWENMTNKELHDKFQQMMGQQVADVMTSFDNALARMDGIEKSIDTKLDAKFAEVLARLPPPAAPLQQQQQPPSHREIALRQASRVALHPGQSVGVAVDTYVAPDAA